jgi:hypothetical protein
VTLATTAFSRAAALHERASDRTTGSDSTFDILYGKARLKLSPERTTLSRFFYEIYRGSCTLLASCTRSHHSEAGDTRPQKLASMACTLFRHYCASVAQSATIAFR